jgi:hypothetical protein
MRDRRDSPKAAGAAEAGAAEAGAAEAAEAARAEAAGATARRRRRRRGGKGGGREGAAARAEAEKAPGKGPAGSEIIARQRDPGEALKEASDDPPAPNIRRRISLYSGASRDGLLRAIAVDWREGPAVGRAFR